MNLFKKFAKIFFGEIKLTPEEGAEIKRLRTFIKEIDTRMTLGTHKDLCSVTMEQIEEIHRAEKRIEEIKERARLRK